jgi:hypothetical protein
MSNKCLVLLQIADEPHGTPCSHAKLRHANRVLILVIVMTFTIGSHIMPLNFVLPYFISYPIYPAVLPFSEQQSVAKIADFPAINN